MQRRLSLRGALALTVNTSRNNIHHGRLTGINTPWNVNAEYLLTVRRPNLLPEPTQTLTYNAFVKALLALAADADRPLAHGILPWTAFPPHQEPPLAISEAMWNGYAWNPPAFAAVAEPDLYGTHDATAMAKPTWAAISDVASRLDCETARKAKQEELAMQLAGRTSFAHNGRIWQGDTASAADIAAAAIRASSTRHWPGDYVWYDATNAPIPMSAADMIALASALSQWRTARRIRARALKDAVIKAGTPDQIAAIDVTAGWPQNNDESA